MSVAAFALASAPAASCSQAVAKGPPTGTTSPPTVLRPGVPAPPDARLSDEHGVTRWAYPQRRAGVRKAPDPAAPVVARLRFLTENGEPDLYLALSQHVGADGATWVHVRVPGRPGASAGWVPRDALGSYHVVRTYLLVNRSTLHATLYAAGRRVLQAAIGVGKASTPTPAGRFYVREKLRVAGSPFYGPRAIGTSALAPRPTDWPGGDVIGLHGTSLPWLVPGRPSHGCIRLRNADVLRLYALMPRGTPVRIL